MKNITLEDVESVRKYASDMEMSLSFSFENSRLDWLIVDFLREMSDIYEQRIEEGKKDNDS